MMRIEDIIRITGGEFVSGDPRMEIDPARISTDSRMIKKGDFFIALKGPNFDASDFAEEAFKKGAVGAIVSGRRFHAKDLNKAVIRVKDTTMAMQLIAKYHRMKFRIPVVAVTGSNGKTTVKEMAAGVLSSKYVVLKNEGTKNNHIGVPQTLLKLSYHHQVCVLELGANHRGELRLLGDIARPNIVVVTNIGPSHLEFFGDLESVFEAKSEIFDSLGKKGVIIVNGDDKFLQRVKSRKHKILKFGLGEKNDFRAANISPKKKTITFDLAGHNKFELNLLGTHNVYNALAAIAVSSRFHVGYAAARRALSAYRPVGMRLNLKTVNGIKIINDAYNSNPLSLTCALEALMRYPARSRWVVSGDMLELGRSSEDFHRNIGSQIASLAPQGLLTFGKLSRYMLKGAEASGMDRQRLWHCASHDEIAALLKKIVKRGDAVLIKGSRGMAMEKVVNKLIADS